MEPQVHSPVLMDEKAAVAALAALAQEMRLRIFRALVGAGPGGTTPGELSSLLNVTGSTLSFHLKELTHAGLVTQEREGRHLFYRPAIDTMNGLMTYLTAHCCQGSTAHACDLQSPTTACFSSGVTMNPKIYNVLFICTHNSARSIMAETLLNHVAPVHFKAFSAGSQPRGGVHPLALQTLERMSVQAEPARSKSWEEFAAPNAPAMDFVFTVCDNAAGEVCPVWPGQPMTAHWGVPDPSAVHGSDELQAKAFWECAVTLKRRIDLMLALPLASLDKLAIQREITDIGRR